MATDNYDLDLLEVKYLAGQSLTESEMTALQEGPRWDAVKKAAGTVGRGAKAAVKGAGRVAGKTIGATGRAVGAVASAPQGLGRAMKQGYQKGLDTIAPGYQPRSSIGQAIAQTAPAAPAPAAPAALAAPAAPAKKPMATRNPQAAPAKKQMKMPSTPGEIVTYTNKKGERRDGAYVGPTDADNGMIQLQKGTITFAIAPSQIVGNEPTPDYDEGPLGDIQKARYQAGLMPNSQFDVRKDAAKNQAVAPVADLRTGSTEPAPNRWTDDRYGQTPGTNRDPIKPGGIDSATGGAEMTTGSSKAATPQQRAAAKQKQAAKNKKAAGGGAKTLMR